ncbi:nitrogen fixation protein NifQ [Rhodovulum euryhalinum]|uniref:Nitrogen fixation protein NifQ n=1 Tax=Rhodovulum euryhalinum TaxID=35805 RepID=A0A4R2KSR9_9RHOB|nr:nitrogen fixation protein NifQ [Rhodovulum euryhalinum]TCO74086.1 nitrogen fixation protein NifQ [Rhodovulum euryhalinum]
MTADEAYRWLIEGTAPGADPFDAHVLASILALAIAEGGTSGNVPAHAGLDRAALARLAQSLFPGCAARLAALATRDPPPPEVEQDAVRDLLAAHATGQGPLGRPLAAMIARRAMEADHLWQDLGLNDRDELSALLDRHFAPLARQNVDGMKWKRFFYRKLCEAEGFVLCTAPVCTACQDVEMCFGEESGEARLARVGRVGREGSAPHPRR